MAADIIDLDKVREKRKLDTKVAVLGVQAVEGDLCVVIDDDVMFFDEETGRHFFVLSLGASHEFLALLAEGIVEAEDYVDESV